MRPAGYFPTACSHRRLLRLALLLVGLVWAGCEEIVDPPLLSAPPLPVVNAWITNEAGGSFVRLTQTQPYAEQGPPPVLSGAVVTIEEAGLRQWRLQEVEPGLYTFPEGFKGTPGWRYALTVQPPYSGSGPPARAIQAIGLMPPRIRLDSLSAVRRENVPGFDDGIYLIAHFQDPPNTPNFYMWRVFVNNIQRNARTIRLSDDANLDGQYLRFELLERVLPGEQVRVELFSLNRETHQYFRGLRSLVESGSPSQAVPENPPTNLRGEALGFFTVASVWKEEWVVNEK